MHKIIQCDHSCESYGKIFLLLIFVFQHSKLCRMKIVVHIWKIRSLCNIVTDRAKN